MVIKALGFEAEDLPSLFGEPDLKVTPRGTLRVDGRTLETSIPGVYAAGDIVRGASLVVWAIVDGRNAAAAIAKRLETANVTPIAAE
jgi:glutamate synthase (NADPH/NADH) small chain